MSTKIRLSRVGVKSKPRWRIVVCEEGEKRNGKVIETLGFYDPQVNPPQLEVDLEKIKVWQAKGARFTTALAKLLK